MNAQMVTFVLAIEEYLIAQVKSEFSPVIETLMSVLMLIQTPDHLYFKNRMHWNS